MRHKKDCPKAGTSEQSRPGLAPRTSHANIISNYRENASPNLDRGGGALLMSWAMIFTCIGVVGLVSQFARLIDWIERS